MFLAKNFDQLVYKKIITLLLVFIVVGVWITYGNVTLELNEYTITSTKIPKVFTGYRIAQVSDLHNAEFGENNYQLIEMLKKAKADIIVITGDIIDCYRTDIQIAVDFAEEALEIAPIYYITGNHEAHIENYIELEESLANVGVIILKDEYIYLQDENAYICLQGINDPSFTVDYHTGDTVSVVDGVLDNLEQKDAYYTICLSHRPELFQVYVEHDIDLVLSGHAHGGQFRIPFIGGIYAPNQGFWPDYDAGLYLEGNTSMIVSRGLGNSSFPFRVNNQPEIILITLQSEKDD